MPSLKSIKNRIKSVKSTQKITKAMKMVAASKMKKACGQAERNALYASRMNAMVQALTTDIDPTVSSTMKLLNGTGAEQKQLLIVISSDRGLCGAFNQVVLKKVSAHIKVCQEAGKDTKILCVGKKGYEGLKRKFGEFMLLSWESVVIRGLIPFAKVKELGDHILSMFAAGEFDECNVIFNRFKSAMVQEVAIKRLIPLETDDECMAQHGCEFEPSEEAIVERLLAKNFTTQLFTAILESNAGEQAARMTAMDNATRNSTEMVTALNLLYNRTRQSYITKELIEIISGAEAV